MHSYLPAHPHLLTGADTALSAPRSSKWRRVAMQHLALFPRCALCKGKEELVVHHILPFHLFPELELDPDNLLTLCEGSTRSLNCHLWFGHLGNFKTWNPKVVSDVTAWRAKKASALLAARQAKVNQ